MNLSLLGRFKVRILLNMTAYSGLTVVVWKRQILNTFISQKCFSAFLPAILQVVQWCKLKQYQRFCYVCQNEFMIKVMAKTSRLLIRSIMCHPSICTFVAGFSSNLTTDENRKRLFFLNILHNLFAKGWVFFKFG